MSIMQTTIIGFAVRVGLTTGIAVLTAAGAAAAAPQKITCPFLEEGHLAFDIPERPGSLPADIDFDYPAKATRFSFGAGRLSLIAVDESEPSRVRIKISAHLNKRTGAFEGEIFVDLGGNQLMLHNGPVRCTVGPG